MLDRCIFLSSDLSTFTLPDEFVNLLFVKLKISNSDRNVAVFLDYFGDN